MVNYMERLRIVTWLMLVLHPLRCISRSSEGDALSVLKAKLDDPNNVLQSWDNTLENPCTWFHVTCDNANKVTRVDLGNAGLSGQLVPELGNLPALQYLELYQNHINGPIPKELGNLMNLVSLDLYENSLSGSIPDTLGKLSKLTFLRLSDNHLTEAIPMALTNLVSLKELDLRNNDLKGCVPVTGSFAKFTPLSFQNNPKLSGPCQ